MAYQASPYWCEVIFITDTGSQMEYLVEFFPLGWLWSLSSLQILQCQFCNLVKFARVTDTFQVDFSGGGAGRIRPVLTSGWGAEEKNTHLYHSGVKIDIILLNLTTVQGMARARKSLSDKIGLSGRCICTHTHLLLIVLTL